METCLRFQHDSIEKENKRSNKNNVLVAIFYFLESNTIVSTCQATSVLLRTTRVVYSKRTYEQVVLNLVILLSFVKEQITRM